MRVEVLGMGLQATDYMGGVKLLEELGARLGKRGHAVTVYNRAHLYSDRPKEVRGMRIAYLPRLRTKSTETTS